MIENHEINFNSSDTVGFNNQNYDSTVIREENHQTSIVKSSNNGNNEKYTDLLNTCKICGEKWFATQLQLETHLSEKHGIGSIQCSQCEYRAIDIPLQPNHYRKFVIHERQCGKKRFLPKTRSGGIFRCGPCRLSFDSRSKKIQHILQQHRDLYENYKKKNAIYNPT